MKSILFTLSLIASFPAFGAHEPERLAPLTEVQLADGRTILANGAGLSVYTFDVDVGRESRCYDACAQAWPPVLVSADTPVGDPIGTTQRRDGSIQLTFEGKPVYLFVGDRARGDIRGDGLEGVWHLIEN